ncbi:MAG: hypothetical protein JWM27_4806 [Gemmatimonadetes bacterium]|nr:hypothetical protein [Gemmatimonadota bacterium]
MAEHKLPDDFAAQLRAARRRGAQRERWEPRAEAVAFDARARMVTLRMTTGVEVRLPVGQVAELAAGTDAELAQVALRPGGAAITCPPLDADLYVPGLLSDVLGLGEWWKRERAAEAGRVRTGAKAASSRENGRRGGRPARVADEPEPRGTVLVMVERPGGSLAVVAGAEYVVDPAGAATHRGRRVVALRYRGERDGRVEARFADSGRPLLVEPTSLVEPPGEPYVRPPTPLRAVAETRAPYGPEAKD